MTGRMWSDGGGSKTKALGRFKIHAMSNARVFQPNLQNRSNNGRSSHGRPNNGSPAPQRRPRLNTTITDLRTQIQRKESQGKQLTAVEHHIATKLSRSSLKPSLGSALLHAGKTLFVPGSVAALALACLFLVVGRAPRASEGQAVAKSESINFTEINAAASTAAEQLPADSTGAVDPGLNAVIDSVKETARVKLFDYARIDETPPAAAAAATEPEQQIAAVIPQGIDPELARKQGLIKFLAGMIAIHHPQIADCGAVAREIVEISSKEKIDPFFVASIISVESRFFTDARSKVGATGLMQLMPNTAKGVAKSKLGRSSTPELTDPNMNIRLGVHYIKELEQKYRGNRYLALAAYNWGPANVDKGARIPTSVSGYATKIMERTVKWRKHFSRAEASATAFNTAPAGRSQS